MGLIQNLQDRFFVAPVAKRILESVKSDSLEKGDIPNIFSVPVGFNSAMSNYNKRMTTAVVDFATLRTLSINHETTRAAINLRKRQITQLGYDIVDLDDDIDPESTLVQRQKVRNLITGIGGEGVRFREILDKLIEDLLALDALCFYKQRQRDGKLLRIIPIDATTIKLRVGSGGEKPLPPDFAFEQWIKGEKTAELTTKDLTYEMMNPRTDSPYGLAPIESLIITLDSSMRAMLYNLNYLSDNNVPMGFLQMPEGWNVQQIKEYKEFFDAMVSGSKATSKVYPIPSSTTYQAVSKPSDYAFKDFFEYLDRRVCTLFDIAPQELGLNLQQYKENADGQERIQMRKGIKPLANLIQEIFTDIIRVEFGYSEFAFKFTGLDTRVTAADAKILIPLGVVNIDEVRNDMGYKKIGVGNFVIAGNTVVPVEQIGQPDPDQVHEDEEEEETDNPSLEPEDPNSEKIEKKKKNLSFDKVQKKKKFKEFKKAVNEALETQLNHFTSPKIIDKVTKVKKDDSDLEDSVDNELPSIEIQGLDDHLKWAATEGGQNAYQAIGISGVFALTNPAFIQMLGDRSNYLIDSVDSTTKDWIVNQIKSGKEQKLTNAQIARQISDNLGDISSTRADRIVNTEVANAMQTAELQTYRDQGIEKKVWITSMDERVCPQCEDLDDEEVAVNDAFSDGSDAPPAHPDCRCFIEAVID